MDLFEILLAGIFGAIFGSYSTLFAYRLPIGESCFGRYFGKKSRCPQCNTIIRTRELIPLLNWLFTLGRCQSCQAKIPRLHLFIEATTTILFIICYIQFSFTENFIIFSLLCAALVIALAVDHSHKIFPREVIIAILILSLTNRILVDGEIVDLIFSVAVGVVFASVFYKIFDGVLTKHDQLFSYAEFIIITSVALHLTLFFLYYVSVLVILTISIGLDRTKRRTISLGFSLIIPFLWLMIYPPF